MRAEFLSTPKCRLLLRIRSNWAKPSKINSIWAPRLWDHFCSLNGWKILSRSWNVTKWKCLQINFVFKNKSCQLSKIIDDLIQPSIFRLNLETKIPIFFLSVGISFFLRFYFFGKNCSLKMKRNANNIGYYLFFWSSNFTPSFFCENCKTLPWEHHQLSNVLNGSFQKYWEIKVARAVTVKIMQFFSFFFFSVQFDTFDS